MLKFQIVLRGGKVGKLFFFFGTVDSTHTSSCEIRAVISQKILQLIE